MQIHIKKKHGDRYAELASKIQGWSAPDGEQPSFSPNHRRLHMYETPHHLNTSADEIKRPEIFLDKFMEDSRRFNEVSRLINESTRNLSADSIFNEIAKSLLIQTASNLFQGKRSTPSKKETLPTGYQISVCDTCLSGCKLRPVFYPIEFEGATKLDHQCDPKNLYVGQNEEEIPEKRRQVKVLLGDFLSKIVSSRIGQRDAYLKAIELSKHAFSEERRRNFKIPANRSLIEERDCIRINPSHDMESMDHWFCRTIRECGKNNNVRITQNELKEFLSIARSTFGVFRVDTSGPAKKSYLLIYLVL
jgi:hypothetical protein